MLQQCSPRKWHGVPGFISWPSITPATHPSQHAVHSPHWRGAACAIGITAPWHFLYFFPLPQGHGSLRPVGIEDDVRDGASSILKRLHRKRVPRAGTPNLLVYFAVLLS